MCYRHIRTVWPCRSSRLLPAPSQRHRCTYSMFTFTRNLKRPVPSVIPLSAFTPKPSVFWTQSRCHVPSTRVKKRGCSRVVKMTEKINNMGELESRQEGTGSPAVLLEWPFIRCSSCWAIHFFIFFSRAVEIWSGRPVGKGNELPVSVLRGTGFMSFSWRPGEDPAKHKASRGLDELVLFYCSIYSARA